MIRAEEERFAALRRGDVASPNGRLQDGRQLIEGIRAPKNSVKGRFTYRGTDFEVVNNPIFVSHITWEDLHFRKSHFREVKFKHCKISNCIFEDCDCTDVGFWESKLVGCKFLRTKLRDVAFGGIDVGNPLSLPNEYLNTIFDGCDLRGSAHSCESYKSCLFTNCNLSSVDFDGAIFEDSVFRGDLVETRFRSKDMSCPQAGTNQLKGCSFKEARIGISDFLNIDLDPSIFPDDPDIIFLYHGPLDWSRWFEVMDGRGPKGLRQFVEIMQKNSGAPTLVSRKFLLESFGAEAVGLLEQIGRKSE